MQIEEAVEAFQDLIECAIMEDGNRGKTAMIRSSKPILKIHEAVKYALIQRGISSDLLYPPLGERTPELKLAGFLKQKDQDVCVVPSSLVCMEEVLEEGLLAGVVDRYGQAFTERTLTINVRSQISSIQKNFDTLFERTYAEAYNLHERSPFMVLGEVYLLAIPEYDDKAFSQNRVAFKEINQKLLEKYIKSFHAISHRTRTDKNFYQYEATSLLIVDFRDGEAKLYHSTEALIEDGLLSEDTEVEYETLSWNFFFDRLLEVYDERFGLENLR